MEDSLPGGSTAGPHAGHRDRACRREPPSLIRMLIRPRRRYAPIRRRPTRTRTGPPRNRTRVRLRRSESLTTLKFGPSSRTDFTRAEKIGRFGYRGKRRNWLNRRGGAERRDGRLLIVGEQEVAVQLHDLEQVARRSAGHGKGRSCRCGSRSVASGPRGWRRRNWRGNRS